MSYLFVVMRMPAAKQYLLHQGATSRLIRPRRRASMLEAARTCFRRRTAMTGQRHARRQRRRGPRAMILTPLTALPFAAPALAAEPAMTPLADPVRLALVVLVAGLVLCLAITAWFHRAMRNRWRERMRAMEHALRHARLANAQADVFMASEIGRASCRERVYDDV